MARPDFVAVQLVGETWAVKGPSQRAAEREIWYLCPVGEGMTSPEDRAVELAAMLNEAAKERREGRIAPA